VLGSQVLVVFKAAPELCNLLRTVDDEYTRAREQHKSRLDGPHADVLPWVQTQTSAFESAALASVRDIRTSSVVSCVRHPLCLVKLAFCAL